MKITENFEYIGTSQNFERDSYATLAEMKAVIDKRMPDIFTATCKETGKLYIYNKNNEIDEILGKWREVGIDSDDYVTKTYLDTEIAKKADITSIPSKVSELTNDSNYQTAEQISSTVTTEIAKVVADAPENFDTLKEMSDWIAGHENDASTMNSAISDNKTAITALQSGKADKSEIPTTVTELTDSADYAKKTDIPTTLPANGGNADTVNNHTVESNVPADAVFTDTTYETVTQTEDGLMSAADKVKLDGAEEGATKTLIDIGLSSTSTNPVQNKVINDALNNKANKSKYSDTTINIGRKASTTVGAYSTAEGKGTTASAPYTHSEGLNTSAIGQGSHAEGLSTNSVKNVITDFSSATTSNDIITAWTDKQFSLANGKSSHVEGNNCLALGDYSHAEGSSTTASGSASHAEGSSTTASGFASHAEGDNTTASGSASHAEGVNTTASGSDSHAEGINTTASGVSSHAEGEYTTASGNDSHAEGKSTTASASYAHSEGVNTSAIGQGSHAEGSNLKLSGNNVIFEDPREVTLDDGNNIITITVVGSQAFGLNSHAEGCSTLAYGKNSHTEGYHTLAQAKESHAEGYSTTASGNTSHAEGYETTASGGSSHAEGINTTASGDSSHAEGYNTTASGGFSHAEGEYTTASGDFSHAEGAEVTASGSFSHAEGSSTTASGNCSHAEGEYTTASGIYSHAEGYTTTAGNYASHASGKYNTAMTTGGNTSNTTGTAFVIGNGTGSSALSNAFSVQFDGTVKAKSTITASTTADYAEFFEWLDKNPNEEDRVGHFVTLDGDKIKIATSEDDYILGIVSGEPFVLGNGDCDTWNGMYLHDEFRRTMYEPAPKMIEILDNEGNPTGEYKEVEGEYEGTRPILNPDYDPTKQYISRFDRVEWSPIGMLGVLAVLHDGTAEVNGYVTVNDEGIATKCTRDTRNSYRVIKKVSDKVVEVIFR